MASRYMYSSLCIPKVPSHSQDRNNGFSIHVLLSLCSKGTVTLPGQKRFLTWPALLTLGWDSQSVTTSTNMPVAAGEFWVVLNV